MSLLQPYKSLGQLTDRPYICLSKKAKPLLLTLTSHSYRLLSIPSLQVALLGPRFLHRVDFGSICNEDVFVVSGGDLYKMHYQHLKGQWSLKDKKSQQCVGFETQKYLLIARGDWLYRLDKESNILDSNRLKKRLTLLLHLFISINKALMVTQSSLSIYNYQSQKELVSFPVANVKAVGVAMIPDVIAVSDEISVKFLHLGDGSELFQVKAKNISSISFNTGGVPLAAFASRQGVISIWDLKERRRIEQTDINTQGPVQVRFLDQENGLAVGYNDLVLWRKGSTGFETMVERRGPKGNLRSLVFIDDFQCVGYSDYSKGEVRTFSLLNQCFSRTFSSRHSKNKLDSRLNTEAQAIALRQIRCMGVSTNRAGFWGNLVTAHFKSSYVCVWSTDDKSIVKRHLEITNPQLKNREVTACHVSFCGNFVMIGYDNGLIIKHNLQSGVQRDLIRNKGKPIQITSDQELKNLWVLTPNSIKAIRLLDKKVCFEQAIIDGGMKSSSLGKLIAFWESDKLMIADITECQRGRQLQMSRKIIGSQFNKQNSHLFVLQEYLITIYFIPNDFILQNIVISQNLVGIALSPDNEFLVGWQQGSKQILVWTNLVGRTAATTKSIQIPFETPLVRKASDPRSVAVLRGQMQQQRREEQWSAQGLQVPAQNRSLIKLTSESIQKWKYLRDFEAHHQSRKVDLKIQQNQEVPFFFDPKKTDDFSKHLLQQHLKSKDDKSKLLKKLQSLWMQPTNRMLTMSSGDLFQFLKQKTCAQADYLIKNHIFQHPTAQTTLLNKFVELLEEKSDFDLKLIYLNTYLHEAAESVRGADALDAAKETMQKLHCLRESLRAGRKMLSKSDKQ